MSKRWQLKTPVDQKTIDKFPEYPPAVLQLLINRGLETSDEMDEFLHPDYLHHVNDPYLFRDMSKAVNRLYQAIDQKEQITVYGDYDADGVPGSVVLVSTLKKLGAEVDVYIPHREKEGYGLNSEAIEYLHQRNTKIIITVDCGISNAAEVTLAQDKGIDVFITDHHQAPLTTPQSFVTLHCGLDNEVYPFKYFAGGGMAFKLASALLRSPKNTAMSSEQKEAFEKWLLDLVMISTVADMVPLIGENRTLSYFGLVVLRQTKRLGLQKMMDLAKINPQKLSTYEIGFVLAPRINAAGRLDHANTAFQLLLTEDRAEAEQLAVDLQATNEERQRLTEQTVKEAVEQTGEPGDKKIIIVYADHWSGGILGLVGSRLVNRFHRPAFVLTKNNGVYMGSGRSIKKFHITDALKSAPELFEKFGGHPGACGFTLKPDKLEDFITAMYQTATAQLTDEDLIPTIEVDAKITLKEINWELISQLSKFEPFGMANPQPKFLLENVTLTAIEAMGQKQNHVKLQICQDNDGAHKAIAFNQPSWLTELTPGQSIDLIFELGINEWNGNREIQIKVIDLKSHV